MLHETQNLKIDRVVVKLIDQICLFINGIIEDVKNGPVFIMIKGILRIKSIDLFEHFLTNVKILLLLKLLLVRIQHDKHQLHDILPILTKQLLIKILNNPLHILFDILNKVRVLKFGKLFSLSLDSSAWLGLGLLRL